MRALITGIAGQDGSYLAELLLQKGYAVYGVVRPGAGPFPNLEPVLDRIELLEADLLHRTSLVQALRAARPREVYNLAAPSFVPVAWDRLIEASRLLRLAWNAGDERQTTHDRRRGNPRRLSVLRDRGDRSQPPGRAREGEATHPVRARVGRECGQAAEALEPHALHALLLRTA